MFVFSEEDGDKMLRVVVINIYFGSAPVPGQLNLLLKTLSLPILICKPSSRVRVDRFLGKSDGLINGNAKDVGASVIGAV